MKKYLLAILTLLTAFMLVACSAPKVDNHTVVISKMYGSSSLDNNIIELYNNSDEAVNLRAYKLDIYGNGSSTVTTSIKLKGKIKANSYFAISSKNIDKSLKKKINLRLKNNIPYNGDDAIALSYNGENIDVVGTIGIDVFFSRGLTLTRLGEKKNFTPSSKYDPFNFIQYVPGDFTYLKNDNYKIKSLEDLYAGPQLSFNFLNMPYKNGNLGTGGAPVATLGSVADGDTATFIFSEKPSGGSHRYYYINTPEVFGTNTVDEPWGAVASKFNKEFILSNANDKEIRVQSVPGGTLTDTYARNLGLIWVNGKLSQFEIVSEGLSKVFSAAFTESDMLLNYEGVPYLTFLLFAEQRAKLEGWGVHGYPGNSAGEKSPDWNYEENKRADAEDYKDWKPRLYK